MSSGHVVDQGSGWTAELVVEPDAGGQGQQPRADALPEPLGRACAVTLQGEQILEGLEDRLDALADEAEEGAAARLVLASRANHAAPERGHGALEVSSGIALVADHGLSALKAARQELQGHPALRALGRTQDGRARGAIEGARQVQAHAPEVARVALAPAVSAAGAELRAAGGLGRAPALHRGGVQQHQVIVESGAALGEDRAEPVEGLPEPAAALVVARLA